MIAKVAIDRPVKDPFDYKIPHNLIDKIKIGQRALVNFGGSSTIGYIVGITKKTNIRNLRSIEKLIDEEPIFDKELLTLARLTSSYYMSSWGEVLESALSYALEGNPCLKEKNDKSLRNEIVSGKKVIEANDRDIRGNKNFIKITDCMRKGEFKTFLFCAQNQESKISFYIKLINFALKTNKTIMLLTPEVFSVNILAGELEKFFPQKVVIFHSQLKRKEKDLNLKLLKEKKSPIIIGTRSAVFAPLRNLGLIIIDEEESDFFKNPERPRFNARKAAFFRCESAKCPLILSSSTPSMESYYNAQKKKYILIEEGLKDFNPKGKVKIIDLNRQEKIKSKNFISYYLRDKIEDSLNKRKKVILLLNRRGFSTFIKCQKCGYIAKCQKCGVGLIYHYDRKELLCHRCNYKIEAPTVCPECRTAYIKYFGLGTEKLESVLHHMYPQNHIGRLDADTLSSKGQREKIISDFNNHKIDILVGTQALLKSINFKDVGAVGVILAESGMYSSDFRAQEKTFSLLYRIIKRGFQENKNTDVIIQTYLPSNLAITCAVKGDYLEFYKNEIKERRSLRLPPFYHFNYITLRGINRDRVQVKAQDLSDIIKKLKEDCRDMELIEADQIDISRVRGKFRQNIIIKAREISSFHKIVNKGLSLFKRASDIIVTVDIDAVEYF